MSVEIQLKEALQHEVAPVVSRASAMTVANREDRAAAMEFLKAVKGTQKAVEEKVGPMVESAHAAWKQTVAFRDSFLTPLKQAEATIKGKVQAFDAEEYRKNEAERARLQSIADEQARKERERLEREAAKLKTPELKEQRLEQAAAVVAPVVQVAAPVKQAGESTRVIWRARLTDKAALITAAANGNALAASFLAFDQVAANRQAVASKNALSVPGLEFYSETSLSVRV